MSCFLHLLCIVFRKMHFHLLLWQLFQLLLYQYCFAAISRATLSSEIKYTSPHDVTIKDQQKANQLASELNNQKIPHFIIIKK